MLRIFTRVTSAAIFTMIGFQAAAAEPYRDRSADAKEIAWMDLGMKLVREKLRDPSSAQFRNVYFHRGVTNTPTTCGEVNAKNGFGGYSGYERFISAGRAEFTLMRADMPSQQDFDQTWSALCVQRPK